MGSKDKGKKETGKARPPGMKLNNPPRILIAGNIL
jgi:hypothetical protein